MRAQIYFGKFQIGVRSLKIYTYLDACREHIEKGKPSLSKVGEAVDRVLTPSSPKDWHKIHFFQRVSVWS